MQVQLPHRRATTRLAREVSLRLQPGHLVLLSGELGAGKTFFTRALLRALGLEGERVQSPTFALVNEYTLPQLRVLHADLYRLREGGIESQCAQVRTLGLADAARDGALLLVEWGDGLEQALGTADLHLRLERTAEGKRHATLSGRLVEDGLAP